MPVSQELLFQLAGMFGGLEQAVSNGNVAQATFGAQQQDRSGAALRALAFNKQQRSQYNAAAGTLGQQSNVMAERPGLEPLTPIGGPADMANKYGRDSGYQINGGPGFTGGFGSLEELQASGVDQLDVGSAYAGGSQGLAEQMRQTQVNRGLIDKRIEQHTEMSDRLKIMEMQFKNSQRLAQLQADIQLADPLHAAQVKHMNLQSDLTDLQTQMYPQNQAAEQDYKAAQTDNLKAGAQYDRARAANPRIGNAISSSDLMAPQKVVEQTLLDPAVKALDAAIKASGDPQGLGKEAISFAPNSMDADLNKSMQYSRVKRALAKLDPAAYAAIEKQEVAVRNQTRLQLGLPPETDLSALNGPPAPIAVTTDQLKRAQDIVTLGTR